MHAVIRGEHRHAAASLWHRHAPNWCLAIGPRHKFGPVQRDVHSRFSDGSCPVKNRVTHFSFDIVTSRNVFSVYLCFCLSVSQSVQAQLLN